MVHSRVIFINVGWMLHYKNSPGDEIIGGGKFTKKHGFGHEGLNFKPFQGYCYGFGRVAWGSIAIERFGAPKGATYVDDVLVVWVAKSLVVGWYKHASLYRKAEVPPPGSNRVIHGDRCDYHAKAKESDCTVLDREARTFAVPRSIGRTKVDGGMGRYVWYAEGYDAYLARLFDFIDTYGVGRKKSAGNPAHARQPDPLKRIEVEKAASARIEQYYIEEHGYSVIDVSDKNFGWDLEAKKDDVELYLEVKGLSGSSVNVELTPNEYKQMNNHKARYRVCIVTNALSANPRISIYAYRPENRRWEHHEDGTPINIKEVIGARVFE